MKHYRLFAILTLTLLLAACASEPTPQKKFASYRTLQLQQRRIQLYRSIPRWQIGFGLPGMMASGRTTIAREDLNDAEMELLRRYEAGDKAAKLEPLPGELPVNSAR